MKSIILVILVRLLNLCSAKFVGAMPLGVACDSHAQCQSQQCISICNTSKKLCNIPGWHYSRHGLEVPDCINKDDFNKVDKEKKQLGETCSTNNGCESRHCKPECTTQLWRCIEPISFYKRNQREIPKCVSSGNSKIMKAVKSPSAPGSLGNICTRHKDCISGNCAPVCETNSEFRCIEPRWSFQQNNIQMPACIEKEIILQYEALLQQNEKENFENVIWYMLSEKMRDNGKGQFSKSLRDPLKEINNEKKTSPRRNETNDTLETSTNLSKDIREQNEVLPPYLNHIMHSSTTDGFKADNGKNFYNEDTRKVKPEEYNEIRKYNSGHTPEMKENQTKNERSNIGDSIRHNLSNKQLFRDTFTKDSVTDAINNEVVQEKHHDLKKATLPNMTSIVKTLYDQSDVKITTSEQNNALAKITSSKPGSMEKSLFSSSTNVSPERNPSSSNGNILLVDKKIQLVKDSDIINSKETDLEKLNASLETNMGNQIVSDKIKVLSLAEAQKQRSSEGEGIQIDAGKTSSLKNYDRKEYNIIPAKNGAQYKDNEYHQLSSIQEQKQKDATSSSSKTVIDIDDMHTKLDSRESDLQINKKKQQSEPTLSKPLLSKDSANLDLVPSSIKILSETQSNTIENKLTLDKSKVIHTFPGTSTLGSNPKQLPKLLRKTEKPKAEDEKEIEPFNESKEILGIIGIEEDDPLPSHIKVEGGKSTDSLDRLLVDDRVKPKNPSVNKIISNVKGTVTHNNIPVQKVKDLEMKFLEVHNNNKNEPPGNFNKNQQESHRSFGSLIQGFLSFLFSFNVIGTFFVFLPFILCWLM